MNRFLRKSVSSFISNSLFNFNSDASSIIKVKRSDTISDFYINKEVSIPSGKLDRLLVVTEDMLGFKFGEFCWTRKMNHSERFKKTKKKKKK